MKIAEYFKNKNYHNIPKDFRSSSYLSSRIAQDILRPKDQTEYVYGIYHQDKHNLSKEMINTEAVKLLVKPNPQQDEIKRFMNSKQLTQTKKREWGQVIKSLKNDPIMLMSLIPSPKREKPLLGSRDSSPFDVSAQRKSVNSHISSLKSKLTAAISKARQSSEERNNQSIFQS